MPHLWHECKALIRCPPNVGTVDFMLEASVGKIRAAPAVTLTWDAVGTAPHTVYRNGAFLVDGIADATYVDPFAKGDTGEYTYCICDSSGPAPVCSNEVTVEF